MTEKSQSEEKVNCPDWLTNPNQKATFRKLSEEERELHGLLVKHRPTGKTGPKPKDNCVNNVNEIPKRAMGNTRAYIEQRLQAEFTNTG